MATKKSSKKSTEQNNTTTTLKNTLSRKSINGKASVDKGRRFEDSVAGLYHLLGAEVTQNVMVCQKKVDVLAEFKVPGSSIKHRVIIECKNEKKVVGQNQRVMEFAGLLNIARQTGQAESAEIITNVPWSDQAKGFARESGIGVLTYTEKVSQLIDFTSYLKDLISKFEEKDFGRPSEPPLGDYYVDLSAERAAEGQLKQIPLVNSYINQWLQKVAHRHLAVLGEFGSGKSSLCLKIAHDLAATYIKEPQSTRIPILLNLRDFTKTLNIEALITSFLDEECGVGNPRFKLFKAMNDAGCLLLIFDGFDEMAVKVDADTLESNLHEIEKLASSPRSKIILTSRPEYFTSLEEERKSLNPQLNVIKSRETEYEPITILPWNEEQIELFLERRVPLISEAKQHWTFYRDRIRGIPNLTDLSQRPVLLDMIVKTLPKLIEDNVIINLPNLYKTYLLEEIRRQKILKRRTFLLTDDSRMSLLQQLAVDMHTGVISTITFTDALNRIESELKPPRNELEAYTRDFLTGSFLARKGDDYRFSHKSILEYLVSTKLIDEIKNRKPDVFGCCPINSVIVDFLVELEPNLSILWEWINSTRKSEALRENAYLGGNGATLVCEVSKDFFAAKDLSGANLKGANLSFANLRKTNLTRTFLKDVRLVGAQFFREDIMAADLFNVIVSVYFAKKTLNEPKDSLTHEPLSTVIEPLGREFHLKEKVVTVRIDDYHTDVLVGVIEVRAQHENDMEIIKNLISMSISADVALYFDEYKHLSNKYPDILKIGKQEGFSWVEMRFS